MFKIFSSATPNIINRLPHRTTGKILKNLRFFTSNFWWVKDPYKNWGIVKYLLSVSPVPAIKAGYWSIRILYSLPCFNEFHNLFYPNGSKLVPLNIGELLTPLSLAYWLADDGSFEQINRGVKIATNCFTMDEVKLLISVLSGKFNLNCTILFHFALQNEKAGYVSQSFPPQPWKHLVL